MIIIHLVAETLSETYLVTDCTVRKNLYVCVYIFIMAPSGIVYHRLPRTVITFSRGAGPRIQEKLQVLPGRNLSCALVNFLYVFRLNKHT